MRKKLYLVRCLPDSLKGTYYYYYFYELGNLTAEQTKSFLSQGFLFQIPTARNLLTGAEVTYER